MGMERTFDQEYIVKCVTSPHVWDACTDDGAGDPDLYFPPMEPVVWIDAAGHGVFMLHPHNAITFEVHTCLLESGKGLATMLAKDVIKWIFENTPCERLITNVPDNNRLALRLAERAGMKQFGVNEKSFKKNGELLDQIMLGISREDICQQ